MILQHVIMGTHFSPAFKDGQELTSATERELLIGVRNGRMGKQALLQFILKPSNSPLLCIQIAFARLAYPEYFALTFLQQMESSTPSTVSWPTTTFANSLLLFHGFCCITLFGKVIITCNELHKVKCYFKCIFRQGLLSRKLTFSGQLIFPYSKICGNERNTIYHL